MGYISKLNSSVIDSFKLMLKSNELMRAVGVNSKNYLSDSINAPDSNDILWRQIIPYRFIPQAIEDNRTYINFIYRGFEPSDGGSIQAGYLEFHIYCHRDNVLTKYGLRPISIAGYIQDIYENASMGGIGTLRLDFFDEVPSQFRTEYTYHYMRFKIHHFR